MLKRYKILLLFIISFILSIFIYSLFRKEEYYYVAIGKSLSFNNVYYSYIDYVNNETNYYYKHFDYPYLTVSKLYNGIKKNDNNICYYLAKSRLITVSFDGEELNNYVNLNTNIENEYIKTISKLFEILRSYNKTIFINVNSSRYSIINKKIDALGKKYNIRVFDLEKYPSTNYYTYKNKTYLNERMHYNLAKYILK